MSIFRARDFLSKLGDLSRTLFFAKIENVEGLNHFDEILEEADGITLSRGNLGIDLPPEKVFLFQKSALHKCNMAGKPAVVTRVVDSMTDNLRPTRAELLMGRRRAGRICFPLKHQQQLRRLKNPISHLLK
ncbi:pyruvate kinase 1, cytosolic-like [Triticum dicoccoides]|uniref:pyruvate kinase 1, cytosolic-like n=1 Tax=Triticum dicoccoides TaxID=85692 RepID=UPI00188F2F0A|nr:pyruvate kinase 1, cytosolic-like [Triticum dicoccoides]